MRYTPVRYTAMRHTPIRYTPVRYTPMRHPPIRCTLVGYMPGRYVLIFESSFVVLAILDFGPCEPITHRTYAVQRGQKRRQKRRFLAAIVPRCSIVL